MSRMKIETIGAANARLSVLSGADLEGDPALFLGGFQQNPELMQRFQWVLAENSGIPSVGLNAFDTIYPGAGIQVDAEKYKNNPHGLLALQPEIENDHLDRMHWRGNVLLNLARTVFVDCGISTDSKVITHCAGANVYLEALWQQVEGSERSLPARGILCEPMIVEGRELRELTRQNLTFEKKARGETPEAKRLISLQELQVPGTKTSFEGAKPMLDILKSPSMSRLIGLLMQGYDLQLVVGEQDIAAPSEVIIQSLSGAGYVNRVWQYGSQSRYGHGYLLAEPAEALETIGYLL